MRCRTVLARSVRRVAQPDECGSRRRDRHGRPAGGDITPLRGGRRASPASRLTDGLPFVAVRLESDRSNTEDRRMQRTRAGKRNLALLAAVALAAACSGGGSTGGSAPGQPNQPGQPPPSGGMPPLTGTDITTYKYDRARTGQNLTESVLTTANVTSGSFGLLRFLSADGKVDAQPLYLSGLSVQGGMHNVVFVATENDSLYAFDADSGTALWTVSLLKGGEAPSEPVDGCSQISPQ